MGLRAALPGIGAEALVITASPLVNVRRSLLAPLVLRHSIPAIQKVREFAQAGGLMSDGTSIPGVYRQLGFYAGRALKGEKATDLAIVQPTKIDLVINLRMMLEGRIPDVAKPGGKCGLDLLPE